MMLALLSTVVWFGTASVTTSTGAVVPLSLIGVGSPLTLFTGVGMAGTVVFVAGRGRLGSTIPDATGRLREVLPYLAALGVVLAVNSVARDLGPEVSWIISWNITSSIHALEGAFVADVQSIAGPLLTTYFSVSYVYGYTVLLITPFLLYFALPDQAYLKRAALAFGANYAIGLVCYILFISYGPRNLIPDLVEPLLYTTYPQSHVLTSKVNANTNVFPSLHTSLSATVVLLAWQSRDTYPRWLYIATPIAASVVVSTMYLGIHWGIDVVAGLLLAWLSVALATRVQERAASA